MTTFITRAYNRFEVDSIRGTVTKFSANEKLNDEINYYKTVNESYSNLSIFFPRIIKSDTGYMGRESSIEMELYDYHNLGSHLIDPEPFDWNTTFSHLSDIFSEWQKITPDQFHVSRAAKQMYIEKTEREYHNFVNGWPDPIFGLDTICINGIDCKNFHVIWPEISEYITSRMCDYDPSFIHGDCCMSNILYGERDDIIRFIDPRGSFGQVGVFGDPRYDIAKLYHSVRGYELFINDLVSIQQYDNQYDFVYPSYVMNRSPESTFEKIFFSKYDKKEIQILTGIIFVSMCARHYDSTTRQRQMFLTGIKILNEALEL